MKTANIDTRNKEIRLWPALIISILTILARYVLPLIDPSLMVISFMGGVIGGVLIAVWWLFFSRVAWIDRLTGVVLAVSALYITSRFIDESVSRANMGLMFWLFSIPILGIAFTIWALLTRSFNSRIRRITMIMTILFVSGAWICLRTNGMNGNGRQFLDWRWSPTYEDRMLSKNEPAQLTVSGTDTATVEASWPGFRGPNRDGIVRGVRIKNDWTKPPEELWRKAVGPGCGSFAVMGEHIFTQEQRGENEDVTCYELKTGKMVWIHSDKARFYEPHAGAGPRATPTLSGHIVYTLGATGIINALDARTGRTVWTRNAANDTGEKIPGWGFCGSPIVVNDLMIVGISGRLAAYDKAGGALRWTGTDGGECYSSPQLFKVKEKEQVVFMSDSGALSVDPETGKKLWDYTWKSSGRILQAAMTDDGKFFMTNENSSIRELSVTKTDSTWVVKEMWDSPAVKAYFNDFTVSKGFAYGYDGPTMTCIDLKNGRTTWRGNRYRGFQVLFPDQDLILILTEKGEVAVVKADPLKFTEISRFRALSGRTWNHPALAGNILLVRNDREMAAYRIADEQ